MKISTRVPCPTLVICAGVVQSRTKKQQCQTQPSRPQRSVSPSKSGSCTIKSAKLLTALTWINLLPGVRSGLDLNDGTSARKRAANTLTAQVWGVPALAPHPQLRRAGMRRVTKKQVLEMAALIYINQKRGCSCCQQTKMMIRSKSKSITIFCSASFLRVSGSESRFRTMISINRGINIANCG